MHVLFYPGLRHCGSPKPLKQIWGWSGWICWAGKELWEICQDSCRSHLEQHRSTFSLFLSHSELGCSVFLIHLYVKYLLEPPEVLESPGLCWAGLPFAEGDWCCHIGHDGGSAASLQRQSRATSGRKMLNPAQVRRREVQLPVLSSTVGGQHGGCHTEKDEKWENHGEGKRPGKQMLVWMRKHSEYPFVSG